MNEARGETKNVLDIDGSEAISIHPSSPPDDDPLEATVVMSSRRLANELDIDISDSVPPSVNAGLLAFPGKSLPTAPTPAAAAPDAAAERLRFDTPAAAPVMAPAPADIYDDDEPTRIAPPMGQAILSAGPPARNTRRGRVIMAVISAACLVVGGIAGFQALQKREQRDPAPPGSAKAAAHVPAPTHAPAVEAPKAPDPEPRPPAAPPVTPLPTPAASVLPSESGDDLGSTPDNTDPRSSPLPASPSLRTPKSWTSEPASPGATPRPKFDPKRI